MNYDHGDISSPLDLQQQLILRRGSSGKEALLMALGYGVGLSINDAFSIKLKQIERPLKIENRMILIPQWIWVQLIQYRKQTSQTSSYLFNSSIEYAQKLVVSRTNELLGSPKSYQALRRTFVKNCIGAGVPLQIIISNTGEPANTIYNYFRLWAKDQSIEWPKYPFGDSQNSGYNTDAYKDHDSAKGPDSYP